MKWNMEGEEEKERAREGMWIRGNVEIFAKLKLNHDL